MKVCFVLTFLALSICGTSGQKLAFDKYADRGLTKQRVRIASAAVLPDKWDKAKNWVRIERLVRQAAEEGGADLVVTPEGALEGYVINEVNATKGEGARASILKKFEELAEPLDGPYLKKAYALAKELGIFLLLGFLERDGEQVHNTALMIDPDGDIIGRYRKTHFAQGYTINPDCYCAGEACPVVHTPFGKMGILICYDRQLPEPARILALRGAQWLLVPSYGSYGITDDWNTNLLRTRARENRMPLIFTHPFQSLLITESGELQAKGEANEVVFSDMRPAQASFQDRLGNRRPHLYEILSDPHPVASSGPVVLEGITVTPHQVSSEMRYRKPHDPGLGARVELFLRNNQEKALTFDANADVLFDSVTPAALLESGKWAWHDTPAARKDHQVTLQPGAMTVWSFNSKGDDWGVGTTHRLSIDGHELSLPLTTPNVWLSAITFTGPDFEIEPDTMTVHIANQSSHMLTFRRIRLWLPDSEGKGLHPRPWNSSLSPFDEQRPEIPANDRGGFVASVGRLPLTHAAVEVEVAGPGGVPHSLWAHLKIKREIFDISGGWISSEGKLAREPYLKTLKRLHIDTGHIQEVAGYTDNPELYAKYPIKRFARLNDFDRYDRDDMLPSIHAVEFLGEPQYGGGKPVPPQEVWEALQPYETSRFATTVTHSEERLWRYYAGLSDYPHYDAYRVAAPAADAWHLYDRWQGETIRWGAPLETIGDMTRSLRELNRPRPIAYWSQGAHDWRSRYRERGSPTPDELRSQAYHALSQRITSLYWFNLSLNSLTLYRDLIQPINEVNRLVRLIDNLLLSGDAYEHQREAGWDLSSVCGPEGALLFANDVRYEPQEKRFQFTPRSASLRFRLPPYLSFPREIFRVDAQGTHNVEFEISDRDLVLEDTINVGGLYIAAKRGGLRARLDQEWHQLMRIEASYQFDPAANDEDFAVLMELLE